MEQPYISMVSCQKGPTRHAYAWQIGPFWQDTLELCSISYADNSVFADTLATLETRASAGVILTSKAGVFSPASEELTYRCLNGMALISQMTFSNAFSWMKTFAVLFKFH